MDKYKLQNIHNDDDIKIQCIRFRNRIRIS